MVQQWGHHQPHQYATIYYGLHERNFLPKHKKHVIFYKQFIDDVFGIWLPHPNPQTNARLWEEFKDSMNSFPGLTWEFEDPNVEVNFMDLTITISKWTHLNISLRETIKFTSIYISSLCPSTCAPPRHRPQYTISNFHPLLRSRRQDPTHKGVFKRLQARGYKSDQIKSIFYKAIS